jgi:hypothetical protein
MAIASQHTQQDSAEIFQKVMPVIQQLIQFMQQQKPPTPPMDGDAQAILQASMAETQRRTANDQATIALKQQAMQQKAVQDQRDQEIKVAINTENNLTTERMKTLDLSVEAARLKKEQQETAVALNERVQRGLGE